MSVCLVARRNTTSLAVVCSYIEKSFGFSIQEDNMRTRASKILLHNCVWSGKARLGASVRYSARFFIIIKVTHNLRQADRTSVLRRGQIA